MTRAEHIAALYREGKSQRAIARTIGISQPAVRKWLLKLGLITPAAVPCEQGRDNLDQRQRAESPQPPLDNRVDSAQGATPALSHCGSGEPRLLTPAPQGPARKGPICIICKGAFVPELPGQRCCCNGCGAYLAGYRPLIEHTADCRLIP